LFPFHTQHSLKTFTSAYHNKLLLPIGTCQANDWLIGGTQDVHIQRSLLVCIMAKPKVTSEVENLAFNLYPICNEIKLAPTLKIG